MPLQENAGYEEDTDDLFPRRAVESNALLSLSASREGWLHGQADAFVPPNKVGQACLEESDCSGSNNERVMTRARTKWTKRRTTRRKDKTPNATWVAFGVRSVRHGSPEDVFPRQVWRAMLLSSLSTSGPRRIGWLHGEIDAIDFRLAKESDCCGSHVKRVLTDSGGVWRAERRCQWRLTLSRT